MLHFWHTSRSRQIALLAVIGAACAPGCGPRAGVKSAAPEPAASRAENKADDKKEPPLAGEVRNVNLTLTDGKGAIVARVKAGAGIVGQTGASAGAAGKLGDGEATLYEKGKPIATFRASQIEADQAARTVKAVGNAIARSLVHKGSPTVRADRMTWRHGESKIYGDGNVLVTRDGIRMPGRSFVADTRLRRVVMTGNGSPAIGHFEAGNE